MEVIGQEKGQKWKGKGTEKEREMKWEMEVKGQ